MTPEGAVKKQICEWLELKRTFFWIQVSGGKFGGRRYSSRFIRVGVSDILGMWDGTLLAIEVKAPGGRVSDEQKKFLREVEEQGGIAFVS